MCVPVHLPWLPGYIDVIQTALVMLAMAGLFPDRPLVLAWRHCAKADPACSGYGVRAHFPEKEAETQSGKMTGLWSPPASSQTSLLQELLRALTLSCDYLLRRDLSA